MCASSLAVLMLALAIEFSSSVPTLWVSQTRSEDRVRRGLAARKDFRPFRAAQRADFPAGVTVGSLPAQEQASPNGDPTVQDRE